MAIKPNPRIFLSAGEASGDVYGAEIIAALRKQLTGAEFVGLGGARMRAEGQQQTVRAEDVAVMGVTEILRHVPKIYASYRRLVGSIRRAKPGAAVLIDFPDVNFRLAKHLRRAGVPVVWFVSPQLWAWKRGRLHWVQERVDKMLVIFPFEEPFYRERGVDAEFVGHPLMETSAQVSESLVEADAAGEREAFAAEYGLDPAKTWIALLPGSRWKEIRANLPTLHELAVSDLIASSAGQTVFHHGRLHTPEHPAAETRYEFLLPVASTIEPEALGRFIGELNAEHLKYFGPDGTEARIQGPGSRGNSPRLTLITGADAARLALRHARASVVASGTATVLAAVVGNPFVVVYRVSALTFALAKRLVEYPEEFPEMTDAEGNLPVAMVNLIAGRRVVPELLQRNFTAENVAAALTPLLGETPERAVQMAALADVRERLRASGGSPVGRVADAVVRLLEARW